MWAARSTTTDLEQKVIAAIKPRPAFLPVLRMLNGVMEFDETRGLLVTEHWCERNRRASDYLQAYQRDKQTRSTTFAVVENATHYFSMLVQAWLFHLASEARSSTPTFPENHLIERLAPGWFWSGSLLTAGEGIAKGDRDSKVKVLGNTQDRLGLLRLPHRGDA